MKNFVKSLAPILSVFLVLGYANHGIPPDSIEPLYANAAGLDLMSDAPWVIKKDAFVFSNLFLNNDSIQMEKTQSDASRVTLGKIVLESAGALGCGLILAYPITKMTKYDVLAGYPIGFSIGPAIGVTLIGNRIMEPNGSFLKSLIGATLGMALGGFIYISHFAAGMMHPETDNNNVEKWFIAIAIGLPVIGATTGYNLGIPHTSHRSTNSERDSGFSGEAVGLSQTKFSLSFIHFKF